MKYQVIECIEQPNNLWFKLVWNSDVQLGKLIPVFGMCHNILKKMGNKRMREERRNSIIITKKTNIGMSEEKERREGMRKVEVKRRNCNGRMKNIEGEEKR